MEYYIASIGGQKKGPFKKNELLANGLTGNMLVWRPGMSQWMTANTVPELASLFVTQDIPPLPKTPKQPSPLQQEIEKSKREIEELRKKATEIDNDNLESLIQKPIKFEAKTKYDFPCPTWIKETLMVLACVAGHFLLGITGITTFFYIFFDIIGFFLCFIALVIGFKIRNLNSLSHLQGTPSREKGDKLARTNGWLVSITTLIGVIIILVQSGLDMFSEGMETGITYVIIYLLMMGILWYHFFKPTKLDNYSLKSSPTLLTNAKQKKLEDADQRRWQREMRQHGLRPTNGEDSDDFDSDSDDYDNDDYDSDDYDSGDYGSDDDWGGGDSGGGGADSDW